MKTMREALREQGTLSAKLRRAQALVEILIQHRAPQAQILEAYAEETKLTARMERAHKDPLVTIMRSLARRCQYRHGIAADALPE